MVVDNINNLEEQEITIECYIDALLLLEEMRKEL